MTVVVGVRNGVADAPAMSTRRRRGARRPYERDRDNQHEGAKAEWPHAGHIVAGRASHDLPQEPTADPRQSPARPWQGRPADTGTDLARWRASPLEPAAPQTP